MSIDPAWRCVVCGGSSGVVRYDVPGEGTEGGVRAESFRPSAEAFGRPVGRVVACCGCGHGSLEVQPDPAAMRTAYADAADPVSLREEAGQVETARRALRLLPEDTSPGRVCDVGCWTGSFLVAAAERGWDTVGFEPSQWASARARARGIDACTEEFADAELKAGSCRLVVMGDVLEHLIAPGQALDAAQQWLEPGGLLYLTVPDAGSPLARAMGRRWWSVLPMHVQYFTRSSMRRLLEDHGFSVRRVATHAKVFTARYYAERLGGYHPLLERAAVGVVGAVGGDRLVAPNFGDRMQVVAAR